MEVLLRKAQEIIALDVEHSSAVDGHRSSTRGGGGGGAVLRLSRRDDREIPAGVTDAVPASAVELAAMSGGVADEVHEIALEVHGLVEQLQRTSNLLGSRLEAADRLRGVSQAPFCWVAQVVNELPFDEAWAKIHARTQFVGVLSPAWPSKRPVCRWTYDFVREWKRLPTRDEMLAHLRSGTVRVRVGGR